MAWLPDVIKACYFLAALLFILGLKRMSSPRSARGGIVWAGVGMLVAVLAGSRSPGTVMTSTLSGSWAMVARG